MTITLERIADALEAAATTHTARSYRRALEVLATWLDGRALTYADLMSYRAHLVAQGQSPQSINQQLAAVRFFLREMANRGYIEPDAAEAIGSVKNLKVRGRKLGNWLKAEQAKSFLDAPDLSAPLGLRDRAILGLMLGAGLRRSEAVGLRAEHFERRDGRWVLVGVRGKHGRTRNIPVADWIKALVDAWTQRAGITAGPIARRATWSEKHQQLKVSDKALTPPALFYIVQKYGKGLNLFSVAPHDLRRTFARLAHAGGAPLKQIQLTLGHGDQATTERYVNAEQDLQMAPSDVLGIEVQV